jgi:hypothetical protein
MPHCSARFRAFLTFTKSNKFQKEKLMIRQTTVTKEKKWNIASETQ